MYLMRSSDMFDRLTFPCDFNKTTGECIVCGQHASVQPDRDKCYAADSSLGEPALILSNDQTQKADAGKSDPMMLEEDLALALEAVNRVLDYGKAKYGARGGWKKVDIERYRSAQARHRRSVMQDGLLGKDDESDLLHLAHEACNALFILQSVLHGLTPEQRKKINTFKQPEPVNK
jgi:hypothetical protein